MESLHPSLESYHYVKFDNIESNITLFSLGSSHKHKQGDLNEKDFIINYSSITF